jgi:hypothetical protein
VVATTSTLAAVEHYPALPNISADREPPVIRSTDNTNEEADDDDDGEQNFPTVSYKLDDSRSLIFCKRRSQLYSAGKILSL